VKLTKHLNGTLVARTCCLTGIVIGLTPAAHAQDFRRNPDLWHTHDAAVPDPLPADPWKREPETTLRYGAIDVYPFLRGSVLYDDNIYITEENKEPDVIWALAPGILLATGDYRKREENLAALQYSPTFLLFTDNSGNNAVDHDAQGRVQFHPGNTTLQLYQGFQRYSGAVADVGSRVSRNIYTTEGSAKYEISPKTAVELQARQAIIDYEDSSEAPVDGYKEWTVSLFFDYALTPKVKIGPGFSAGWMDVPDSVNQTYQQVLARASYEVSEKLDLNCTVGGEIRQFEGDRDNRFNGVFSIGARYQPLENTFLTLDAYRRDEASVALVNQNYTFTGFSASARQNFAVLYSAALTGGYYHADYHSTVEGGSSDRDDDHFYVRLEADWNATGRLTVGAFYQYRSNDSSAAGFSFDNNQFGLKASYRF